MIVNSRGLIRDLAVFWFISVAGRCFKNQIVLIRYCLHFTVHFDTDNDEDEEVKFHLLCLHFD